MNEARKPRSGALARLKRIGVNITGPFLDMILPFLVGLLQKCMEPKPVPTPQPDDSQASPEAWKKADESQTFAEDNYNAEDGTYERSALHYAAVKLRQKHRKEDGERLKMKDAMAIVAEHLDQVRENDLEYVATELDSTKALSRSASLPADFDADE